jgi:hypothetical protein
MLLLEMRASMLSLLNSHERGDAPIVYVEYVNNSVLYANRCEQRQVLVFPYAYFDRKLGECRMGTPFHRKLHQSIGSSP